MMSRCGAKVVLLSSLLLASAICLMRLAVWLWALPLKTANGGHEVALWLDENHLSNYQQLFQDKGISQLTQCGQLGDLPELPAPDEQRLQKAAALLQQRLVLRQWLTKHNLQNYYPRLLSLEVASLEDVYWFEDSKAQQVLQKDFPTWTTARQSLPISKQRLESLKADLWSEVVKTSSHQDAWTWGGMLVVSVSMAGLVTLAAITQPSLAPEAKHSLLQYVTGKYLLPSNCKVIFNWSDPHTVGSTVCFTVHFFQRNGQPYPICDTDQLSVEVSEGSRKMAIITELGSPTDPNSANQARVKFMVRHAGHYRISVMIGNQHVAGSPFTRGFTAGPADAQRTIVLRHCSTVVCTASVAHLLYIEPRDEYNNVCTFTPSDDPTRGYTVTLTQLGGKSQSCNPDVTEEKRYTVSLDYDWQNQRISIQLKFLYEGCFHATIKYNGTELHNGDFDIIVLNSIDSTLVHKNVASKNHNICYEAKLVGINGDHAFKPKRVLCYVSPKQLIIKELILKFIPKRLYTFRLCPSTKFTFQPSVPSPTKQLDAYDGSFTIEDGCQPKLELVSKERNVIAATFAQYLLKNMGGSETFKDKQEFFYHEVRKYHQKHYHEKLSMKVNREKLLESSMKATKNFSVSDWCRNFEITFQGEEGIDWGGVRREWFELICVQLFDPKYNLFRSFHDGQQSLVHPNAHRTGNLKLKHYEFAGKVVGKCLYESALGGSYRQLVRARFTRSFLAQVIGLRVHYKYFEQDDPDLYLSKVKYILDNDIDEIDTEIFFVEEQYDSGGQLSKLIELIPNGTKIRVDDNSKHQYLDALAQYRLAKSIKDELEAFLKGLNELIPDNLLSIFDENELELLLCGTGQYSIADFKQHNVVNGNSVEFRRIVGWFWAAVSNFTQEEMARLLQFTTGCSQLPPGGFKELNPRFQITAAPTFGNLPTAHTCFNQLCLPDYDSYEHFEKSLLLAISEGTEGFGMV
ncbi:PREDICTED: apoptosis-resistant E3 ubiquitin protein ligase 1 isoform X2 [Nicrophorus vespilloides]|uniref:HECT-type E3 ubiquitin transferase n=1 Tax=Nicrophorus vespilloides TaxID=110193 RepID=A0ABM1MAC7_NICVS|nr:PREDICTED: apoptosis-resistant E3 ubiquitin protein ligase 1 isoform X2 [Nicrophorus vespilloides]